MRIQIDPNTVSKNFAAFQDNATLHESAQLFAKGLPIAEMIQALAMNQNVLSVFSGFQSIYPHGNLERGVLEKVILCVSMRNNCQFCVDSHRQITRAIGISASAADDPQAPEHTPREALAIEYAAAVHQDSNRISEELHARLEISFTDPEIVELTFLIGFINMLNWFNNSLQIRFHQEFEGIKVT